MLCLDEEGKSRRRKNYQELKDKQEDIVVYDSKRSSRRKPKKGDPISTTQQPISSPQRQNESPIKLSDRDERNSKPLIMKKQTGKSEYEPDNFSRKISVMEPNNSFVRKENNDMSRNIQSQNKTMDKTKITYPSYSNPEAIMDNNLKSRETPLKELEDLEEGMKLPINISPIFINI